MHPRRVMRQMHRRARLGSIAVEPQLGDRLIHVVIDGYHPPIVETREHDIDGASPFLRVRCRATRRSVEVEA